MSETQDTPDVAFGSHAGKVRKGDGRRQRGNRTGFTTGACSAAESKDLLMTMSDLPWVAIRGRKGGSTLVVAAIHALLAVAEAKQVA